MTTRGTLFLVLLGLLGVGVVRSVGAEEPLPLVRIQVPPERVPEAMTQAGQGRLVETTRGEFEQLLREAGRAGEALRNPPRLAETHYRGVLVETPGPSGGVSEAHLSGSGHWKLTHSSEAPGLLTLPWLNIAVSKPHFEARQPALLGELDGKSLGLLVEKPGSHTVAFDWSSRGELRPEALHFQLDLPPSPVASLELDVPAGYVVAVASEGCTRSGPHPAVADGRRIWKIGFSSRAQVVLLVRRGEDAGAGPPLLASLQTRQDILPDALEAVYDFDLKTPPAGVTELRLEHEASLRPFEVNAPALETWGPDGEGRLLVRLREPLQGGKVTVKCLGPLAAGAGPWVSPGMRIVGAVPRGEALTLRLNPNVRPEDWQPGSFRLTGSKTESDGTAVLTLTGGGIESATGLRRPTARLHARGPEYATREVLWWQADPEKSLLASQITWDVLRGRLFQLPVSLPPDWEVDRVEVSAADLLRGWGVKPGKSELNKKPSRATLLVELQRGLGFGEPPATLTVWLRPSRTRSGPAASKPVRFPDVVPIGTRIREGVLAVSFEEKIYEAVVNPRSRPTAVLSDLGLTRDPNPWGKQVPDLCFPYRGQPVPATLLLRPLRPRVRVRCTSEVLLTAGRAALAAHVLVQPELGQPDTIDLALSSPTPAGWTWKIRDGSNAILRVERLPAVEAAPQFAGLAARSPLGSAVLTEASRILAFRGEIWRLTLERPLTDPVALEASALVPVGPGQGRLDVPLVLAPGAARLEGEVKMYLAGTNQVQVITSGLRQPPDPRPGHVPGGTPPWRSFRYTAGSVSLALSGNFTAETAASDSAIGLAHLTSRLEPGGGLRHEFTFPVWNWRQRTLPLGLPSGTRLLSARVNGRWLERLQPAPAAEGEGERVELPVPGEGRHQLEIVYAADTPTFALWADLEAPAPHLPIEPHGFRRTWQLPRGVLPLMPATLQPLPRPGNVVLAGESRELNALSSLFRSLSSTGPTSPEDDAGERRREQFARIAVGEGEGARTLGEALTRAVFSTPREMGPILIDEAALRDAGIAPSTPLPTAKPANAVPRWSLLGLVEVPCPTGLVLTTRRQQSAWEAAGVAPGRVPEAIARAAAQAALQGHDRSGRFAVAADWVAPRDFAPAEPIGAGHDLPPEDGSGWTAWECISPIPTDGRDRLPVVRDGVTTPAGVVLALLPALLFWRLRTRRTVRRAILLGWLALAGLGALWAPPALAPLAWWPLAAAAVVSLSWYLWSATRTDSSTPSVLSRSGLRVAGLLLPALVGFAGTAAPPGTPTVFLLPASEKEPNQQPVLIPPDLLEQIRGLAQRGAAGLRGAVLLAASSEGEAGVNAVTFETEFHAHVFGDAPAILAVPLDGGQLEELFLDGARAFAAPLPAPQAGFSVRIEGAGNHTLRVRFRVPIHSADDDRECQLTLPRLLQNRVSLRAPLGASYLHLSGRLGAQNVIADDKGLRLEAEPGPAAGALQFRWRQEGGPPRPPAIAVQELYLWNLSAESATLQGQLEYTVTRGAVTELDLDLPEQTEVRAVEAGPKPKLKGWHVAGRGNRRRLRLEFQGPITSTVQLRLELVPREPFRGEAMLPLPTPREARTTRGLLAYRLDGLRADITAFQRARPVVPADFSRDWRDAGGAVLPAPAYACLFDRKPSPPALGLLLRPATPRLTVVQDLTWRLALSQADLRAVLRLTAPEADLSLLEWEVPESVTIARVSGAEVRSWSRSGGRLQVWLTRAVSQTEIQLAGWSLPKKPEGLTSEIVWDLPRVGVPAADEQTTLLRLTAVSGHSLSRVQARKLGSWPDPRPPQPSEQELHYLTRQVDYSGSFRVQAAATRADVQILTFAEIRDRELAFVSRVICQSSRGELRSLTVRLSHWEGGDVRLDALDLASRQERREADGRTWALELQPGIGSRYQFSLEGTVPLAEALEGIPTPEVMVEGAARSEQWLAVAGSEISAEEPEGVVAVPDPPEALRPWPREAERIRRAGGAAWRVVVPEGGLRLVPRRQGGGADAVRVFLTEHEATVLEGRGWVHEATYWLRHEAGTDLNLTLPAWAWAAGVTVDGSPVTPLQRERSLWLPLPGGAGVRRVRLRWTFEDGAERLDRPNLDRPRIEGVAEGPVVWTVRAPTGYVAAVRLNSTGELRPADRAAVELWRADAQLRLSAALALMGGAADPTQGVQLAVAQRRFYSHWRLAEYALSTASSPSAGVGPTGQSLGDWLREMAEENRELSVGLGFEEIRLEAQQQVRAGEQETPPNPAKGGVSPIDVPLPTRGLPFRWVGKGDAIPSLELIPLRTRQREQTILASVALIAALFSIWLLSRWSWAVNWAKVFWPEEIALLGYLGWQMAGPNVLFAFLCLLGVSGRLILLFGWLASALRRSPARRPSTMSAVPRV